MPVLQFPSLAGSVTDRLPTPLSWLPFPRVLNGKTGISPEMALKLEAA